MWIIITETPAVEFGKINPEYGAFEKTCSAN